MPSRLTFPEEQVEWYYEAVDPRSQWRDRAGFAPDFPFTPSRAPEPFDPITRVHRGQPYGMPSTDGNLDIIRNKHRAMVRQCPPLGRLLSASFGNPSQHTIFRLTPTCDYIILWSLLVMPPSILEGIRWKSGAAPQR